MIYRFRTKACEHGLDKKLVDRTVELAKRTKKYSWKHLKVALDSSPLEGAGRVEDTWNLIGRAISKVVSAFAKATGVDEVVVIEGADLTVLEGPSVKAALDVDWGDAYQRHEALQRLVAEAERLEAWVVHQMKDDATKPPVSDALTLVRRVVEQDLEPDPDGGGDRIRDGVAEERVISVGDPEMRHGRKSKSKTITGYKRHVVIANRIILGTAVEPANRREHEPAPRLFNAAHRHGRIVSVHLDRGDLPSPEVAALWRNGVELHARASGSTKPGIFSKAHFQVCVDEGVVACAAGQITHITPSGFVGFDGAQCRRRPRKTALHRRAATHPAHPRGREAARCAARRTSERRRPSCVPQANRGRASARAGRGDSGQQGPQKGVRKNGFDVNRTAAVVNLQEIARLRRAAQRFADRASRTQLMNVASGLRSRRRRGAERAHRGR